jgi:hypothetical protein
MKPYTLIIHTQQGTLAYQVMIPEYGADHKPVDPVELFTSDAPVALDTAEGGVLIVQGINAVAIEIAEASPPS